MSTVQVIAVEPFDGHQPGAKVDVTERQAEQLIAKGLAKMSGPHSNKMKPAAENKACPSKAAGQGRTSSASPAARRSRSTTATASDDGSKQEPTGE